LVLLRTLEITQYYVKNWPNHRQLDSGRFRFGCCGSPHDLGIAPDNRPVLCEAQTCARAARAVLIIVKLSFNVAAVSALMEAKAPLNTLLPSPRPWRALKCTGIRPITGMKR